MGKQVFPCRVCRAHLALPMGMAYNSIEDLPKVLFPLWIPVVLTEAEGWIFSPSRSGGMI